MTRRRPREKKGAKRALVPAAFFSARLAVSLLALCYTMFFTIATAAMTKDTVTDHMLCLLPPPP
jgi:hypothetical protein